MNLILKHLIQAGADGAVGCLGLSSSLAALAYSLRLSLGEKPHNLVEHQLPNVGDVSAKTENVVRHSAERGA
jgi:hypothetical protein